MLRQPGGVRVALVRKIARLARQVVRMAVFSATVALALVVLDALLLRDVDSHSER